MAGKKKGGPAVPMPGMDEVKYVLGVTSGKGTDAVSFFVCLFLVNPSTLLGCTASAPSKSRLLYLMGFSC